MVERVRSQAHPLRHLPTKIIPQVSDFAGIGGFVAFLRRNLLYFLLYILLYNVRRDGVGYGNYYAQRVI